jgi:hypothetical protein
MTTQQLLWANCAALALLAITIYISRATFRRVVSALAGGIAAALLNVGQDALAHSTGWWHYPSVKTPYGPMLMYSVVVLWYGAGVALIGWRVTRRFGGRGLMAFIGVMGIYGPARDYAAGAWSGAIVFAPGVVPVIADAACWASGMALAQGVMRLVGGPAKNDRLARLG